MRQRTLPGHRFAFEVLEERQLLATITVNTVSDSDSAGTTLSLRQAIEISDGTLAVSSLTPQQQALVIGPFEHIPIRSISIFRARRDRSTTSL